MVTHRGTGQKGVTVHVAAEPADGPGSETTTSSFCFTEATDRARCRDKDSAWRPDQRHIDDFAASKAA